ncbi:hypothetical protein ACFW2Y_08540 [Streptomyces sp. NPDC058877]|uniref:hypothetical protein n=1 Tax=Streptomyces sp. NPDC058877 TaxID=3346665 RepID=UPI00367FEA02
MTIAIVVFLVLFIGLFQEPAVLRWGLSCGVGNLFFGLAYSEPWSEPSDAGPRAARRRWSWRGEGRAGPGRSGRGAGDRRSTRPAAEGSAPGLRNVGHS